ncbi:DUF748 domain-containing protein [Tamlana sp. 2_MG-2023]|uniref:DUF748 domain-containing protein n=1 Tax=unclassified Tamlana TaxID=2614803 RepID=UPI0026E18B11|nr:MULTISPECIES: DUF748 domain-containing protein [unclassified Tamlana]MDO6760443.1 DUF748 domain-containing protein [Tamlana sp. 2_MG-2023]MDO6789858.1 DUF748 domain-containing protein [Tamlana sp. 1_MG-2023]
MISINKKTKIILFSIIAIIIIALAILPTVIKNYAINNSKTLIGRQINIGNLKYNYFTSTVKVYDFKMFEQNDKDHFIVLDTFLLNLNPLKLINDKVEIEQLYFSHLTVNTVMKDSTFNFDDLVAFHASSDTIKEEETPPLKFSISQIELMHANFFFNDKNVNKETHIEDFDFQIPYIGWDQEEKSNADLKFNLKNGGYFKSSINIHPANGEFDAQFTISELQLKPFYEYVAEHAEINSLTGSVNSQILITGNTNEASKAIISGKIDVNDFEMTDKANKKFLGAKHIESQIKAIDNYNSSYTFETFKIDNSYTFFQLDSTSNNFFRIFKLDNPETTEETVKDSVASTEKELYYAVNHLIVENSVLDYTDNLTGEPFNYHLSAIEINSKDITSTANWIDIYSTMLLNNRGTLKANLGINPNDYYNSTLDISVENFLLPDLNIYTNYYMGHSILQGDMFYTSKSKIVDGQIESENKLLVKNASLENTKGGLYNLPLKFAFFLLTDKNGDIHLDVPVKGNLNDPEINIRKIVWQTFKNVIGKTVAAPVNFLVGLVGGDPKDLEEINFTYTDSIPSEKNYKQLDKLIELEQKKPELKIDLTYFVDTNLQGEALAKAKLGKAFYQETQKDYEKQDKEFEEFVYTKAATDSLSLNDAINKLVSKTEKDSLVTAYKNSLLISTETYIKEQATFSKIEIKEAKPEDPENTGAYPKFKISYGMTDEE